MASRSSCERKDGVGLEGELERNSCSIWEAISVPSAIAVHTERSGELMRDGDSLFAVALWTMGRWLPNRRYVRGFRAVHGGWAGAAATAQRSGQRFQLRLQVSYVSS